MDYFVYALEHTYMDETHRDSKLLGYFDDADKVEKEKQRLLHFCGLADYPNDFHLKKVGLNKINWQNGLQKL